VLNSVPSEMYTITGCRSRSHGKAGRVPAFAERWPHEKVACVKGLRARLKVARRVDDVQGRAAHHQAGDSRSADAVAAAQFSAQPELRETRGAFSTATVWRSSAALHGPAAYASTCRLKANVGTGSDYRHASISPYPVSPGRHGVGDDVIGALGL
jgi:hypothetical protein